MGVCLRLGSWRGWGGWRCRLGLGGVDDWWVMGGCGFLFLGEFVADKIPGFDVIWNLLHTFVRIPVAGLLAFAAASPLPLGMQMVVTVVGAGFAAVAHGSKTALRVAVLPSPEPVSNVLLSLGEDGVAVGLGWVALRHPLAGGLAVMALTMAAGGLAWWGGRRIRAGWRRRFGDRRLRPDGSLVDRKTGASSTCSAEPLRQGDRFDSSYANLLHGESGEFLPEAGVDGDAQA